MVSGFSFGLVWLFTYVLPLTKEKACIDINDMHVLHVGTLPQRAHCARERSALSNIMDVLLKSSSCEHTSLRLRPLCLRPLLLVC